MFLKGNMSLVGPRPVVKEELKEYGHREREFYLLNRVLQDIGK